MRHNACACSSRALLSQQLLTQLIVRAIQMPATVNVTGSWAPDFDATTTTDYSFNHNAPQRLRLFKSW